MRAIAPRPGFNRRSWPQKPPTAAASHLYLLDATRAHWSATSTQGDLDMPKGTEKKKTNNKPKLTVKEKKEKKKKGKTG
jgi:hypothetical protein